MSDAEQLRAAYVAGYTKCLEETEMGTDGAFTFCQDEIDEAHKHFDAWRESTKDTGLCTHDWRTYHDDSERCTMCYEIRFTSTEHSCVSVEPNGECVRCGRSFPEKDTKS